MGMTIELTHEVSHQGNPSSIAASHLQVPRPGHYHRYHKQQPGLAANLPGRRPDTTVTVQKRWDQTITLPLVSGASDTLQAIEIAREGTSITNSETSFSGFDGNFAQNCTITVQQAGISISYGWESPSSTNQASQPSNSTPSNAPAAAAGGIGVGGGYPGGGYGNSAFRAPNDGAKTSTPDSYGYGSNTPAKPAPLKKNVLAGSSGGSRQSNSP